MSSFSFHIDEIQKICHAEEIMRGDSEIIERLYIDSRHIPQAENTLFIAIVGEKHNGHRFIEEAYEKGIRVFLISDPDIIGKKLKGATVLLVDDTLKAFQQIAASHRKKYKLPVLAISGSNGKTIIKEWLFQLLSPDLNIVRSPGSFNSQVGVPLSVCGIAEEHELAIFEAGISLPEEMEKLEAIIKPEIGIFSNIGPAHDENFINTSQKVAEKLNLFVHCKSLIFCSDHYDIKDKLYTTGLFQKIHLFSWGKGQDNDLIIKNQKISTHSTSIEFTYLNKDYTFSIPFSDKASLENVIHCISFMFLRGYKPEIVQKRLSELKSIKMRLELKDGINACAIINDSYNSDINSLSIALDFLEKNKRYSKKTLILSDILQSGKREDELVKQISDMISQRNVSRFIGIGEVLTKYRDLFNGEKEFYKSTTEFIQSFNPGSFENEVILLKGARKYEFEEISRLLEAKVHNTVLEINLNALTHNLNFFKSKLNPAVKLMVMVKAFAYGSGVFEIASHLQYHRIDYLAVAYTDEGIDLRKSGIQMPIMVMNPEENHLYFLLRYKLEPEIYSFRLFYKLIETVEKWNKNIELPVSIHLKFDTGMHRLGFDLSDIPKLMSLLKQHKKNIKLASVYSHLAASDEEIHDDYTKKQIKQFRLLANQIESEIGYSVIKHIANSSAILRFPDSHFDMVRLGIGLYGVAAGTKPGDIEEPVSFKTRISQIRTLAAKESVGYSRMAISNKLRKIATLSIGYADGFRRSFGNENWQMMLHGKMAPVIGNVCMDMCMIDISDIPEAAEGDEVLIFGSSLTLNKYAEAMGTISYEALTSVSPRVKRIYIQHGS